ncbi:MAG TPA: CotH kinase family protein [Verrucomicrobiota bacterium]|nr:hypothetical protein [Verrucomicrobiales bacterium]HRI14749.1 CotH kinase family protein [Verrucomicrobiota bacterium]
MRLLPKAGWKRWLALIGVVIGSVFGFFVLLIIGIWAAFQSPRFQGWFFQQMIVRGASAPPEEMHGHPGPTPTYAGPIGDARLVKSAGEIFGTTNVWNVHLQFSEPQWAGIQSQRVRSVPNWMKPDGSVQLRNTNATRNGLAGVLGFDFPWSTGRVDFAGVIITNAGVRFKGNGTYLGVLQSYRKSFKLDVGKYSKDARIAGRSQFNLGNLSADLTCLSDTLAYELFRDAGVAAPRTAFARVFLGIDGLETNRLLGLYVLVENPDAQWAKQQFGEPGVALFKPVTYELFADLGTNWAAYDGIYDPKTDITPAQQERVMGLSRLVTHASDNDFARQVAEWVDLDQFARFLATEVLLSNYDGILSNGQNFLMYLDPRTNRFGFIPWDLDHSWGEFPFLGSAEQREHASIRKPWVGTNRFLERMMSVEAFNQRYRQQLYRLLDTVFIPERLNRRVDEVAAAARPLVAEWSPQRLAKFEVAVASEPVGGPRDGNPMDPNRPVWQFKRFIATRAENVRAQLDGKAEGIELTRQGSR